MKRVITLVNQRRLNDDMNFDIPTRLWHFLDETSQLERFAQSSCDAIRQYNASEAPLFWRLEDEGFRRKPAEMFGIAFGVIFWPMLMGTWFSFCRQLGFSARVLKMGLIFLLALPMCGSLSLGHYMFIDEPL
jgi:hypothetical protein